MSSGTDRPNRPTQLKHTTNLEQVSIDPLKLISCGKVCYIIRDLGLFILRSKLQMVAFWLFLSKYPSLFLADRAMYLNRMICDFTCMKNCRINHADFIAQRETFCGDSKKALTKYTPNAARSRLRQSPFKYPSRNISHVDFGKVYSRQFVTSNQNIFRGESGIQSSNQAIVAQKVSVYHALQAR